MEIGVIIIVLASLAIGFLAGWSLRGGNGTAAARDLREAIRAAGDDPVEYARLHVTSPGAHALLDEVERGRECRLRQHRGEGRMSDA